MKCTSVVFARVLSLWQKFIKKRRKMSFATDGFFSPSMSRFTATMLAVPEYGLWFEFAKSLNRLGLEMLRDHEVPTTNNQQFMVSVLFVRAHKSFQASILLAEIGLIGNARTVSRGAVEGAIALCALSTDDNFSEALINAHFAFQRAQAKELLEDEVYKSMMSQTEIGVMEATVRDVAVRENAGAKINRINWHDVARDHHCPDLYKTLYRLLSNDGTHTNVNAMHREITYGLGGNMTGVKIGPDVTDMIETLKAACMTFIWSAKAFADLYEKQDLQTRIQNALSRFQQLPQAEPQNVSVNFNF